MHGAFFMVFAAAVALRLLALSAWSPAYFPHPSFGDSASFVDAARLGVYTDPTRPAGYPALLAGLHALSDRLTVTIVVQHILGLAGAVLLWASVLRAGGPRWVAVIAGGVVALNGDQIFLEHTLLSDVLFQFFVFGALYCAASALETRKPAWLVLTGAALGAACVVRSAGLVLIPLLALLVAVSGRTRQVRHATVAALLVVAPALALLTADAALRAATTSLSGLSPTSGWSLYARTAQFADCSKFNPPPGTRALCESTPPAVRPGPTFYASFDQSPAKRLFGAPPAGNDALEAFARAAIVNQPFAYARAVGIDVLRYVKPDLSRRPSAGLGPEALAMRRADPEVTISATARLRSYYDPFVARMGPGADVLRRYQQIVRFHGVLYALAFALVVTGLAVGSSSGRMLIALYGGVGVALIVFSAAVLTYNPRYGLPASGPLAVAALIGLAELRRVVLRASVSSRH